MLLSTDAVARPDQEAEDEREQSGYQPLHRGDHALGVGKVMRRQEPLTPSIGRSDSRNRPEARVQDKSYERAKRARKRP